MHRFTSRSPRSALSFAAVAAAVLTACVGETKPSAESTAVARAAGAGSAANAVSFSSSQLAPDPGGKVIVVETYSDAVGNYFKPAEIHAKRGDVIRYTLKVGVHNVHFLADSNAGRSGYPQSPSDMLQLPGQTIDLPVTLAAGTYYFQCDPHAALGMKGHLIVE